MGRVLLGWAAREALARGKAYLRLDVMADNPRIRAYYESAGFVHVRDLPDHPWPASLYEQRVVDAGEEPDK
jgi:ribosomal protein S18 acetylase RimI-like enzyme